MATTKAVKLISDKEREQLRAYLQSMAILAVDAQDRLDGDKEESYVNDILMDIRNDLERAEVIAVKEEEL